MPFRRRSKDAGGVLRSLTSDPALRLPFLLVFDVAADYVCHIGVLFFLFLDKGVVVVRVAADEVSNKRRSSLQCRMSAFGIKRTFNYRPAMSAFRGKADIVA